GRGLADGIAGDANRPELVAGALIEARAGLVVGERPQVHDVLSRQIGVGAPGLRDLRERTRDELRVVALRILGERGRARRDLVRRGGGPRDLALLQTGRLTDQRQQPGLADRLDLRFSIRPRREIALVAGLRV